MLNNLPNFLNLIVNRKIKTAATIADTDLIPLGTKDPNFLGGYQPTAITYQELASAIGGGTAVQSVTGLDTDNTDPLNPVVQISVDGTTVTGDGTFVDPLVAAYQAPAVDGTTVTGDGTGGNPLVASFQSPAVDGVTITGDGTPGNPLVAAGGGAVNYANVIFVDSTNGNDTTGAINDFTKPYATLDYALSIAAITGASFSARGLIYIRKGLYYVSSQGSPSTFVDYFDMYSDLGVVITAFGYGRISDINSAGPVNVNFMGYADLSNADVYITRASTVNIQVNSITNDTAAFLVIPGSGTANVTIEANKIYSQGLGTSYGITIRNSSNVTVNIKQQYSSLYSLFDVRNHSGRIVVNAPKLVLANGNIYGYGGNFKQVVIIRANLGGEMIINGDLVNEETVGYSGSNAGMIARVQDSWGTLRLNGSIYSTDMWGINAQGTSAASRTIVNGDIRTNHLIAYVGNSSQVILRNGTLMNWNTYSAALLYPVLALGGTASGLYVENCNMYSLGTGGAGGINKDTQASTLVVNNVLYSGADTVGYFVINTVGGQPVNNARFNNVRSSKPLDTNITDLLSPTGFILDTNTLAPNFI